MCLPCKGFMEEVRVHFGRVYIRIRFKQNDEKGLPVWEETLIKVFPEIGKLTMCTWLENMDVCVFYGCVGKKKSPHSQHLKITIIYHPIASMDQKSGLNLAGSPLSISQAKIKVFLWGAPLPRSCGCWQSSAPCCCVSEFLYFSSCLLGKDPS